ncbi:Hypp5155 [Branchiostoma lanceolatum]|uniref:Hypp5155 protein n=1 Tax=Branchiostoma lanceolatum TaxID=7740 RepID=A0A8K0F132_BRALA|nr:Hypp5155 [Branchiostoma lanceolatum]
MATCRNPTVSNCCLGFTDSRKYKLRRPDRSSPDWNEQGIYAIMEPGFTYYNQEKPILYVGRGNIGERLERHFRGTDGQDIGNHLLSKSDIDGSRHQLDGIKVYWKAMCGDCHRKLEESFIQCVENSLGYRPPYNRIAGSH